MRGNRLRAVVIVIASALLAVSVLGAAASAWAERAIEGEAVGVPRHGDRAAYRGLHRESGEPAIVLHFEWAGAEEARDEWGRPIEVDVLHTAIDVEGAFRHAFGGGALVPAFEDAPAGESSAGGGASTNPLNRSESEEHRQFVARRFGEAWALQGALACIPRAGWQGMPLADVAARPAEDLCPSLAGPGARVVDGGVDEVGGVAARRIGIQFDERRTYTFWLSPDVPYPLAVAYCSPGLLGCRGSSLRDDALVLVGFEPGTGGALLPVAPPRPDGTRPATDFGPVTRTGLVDDAGSRYGLDAAVREVEADAGLEGFQAWRATHPATRVVTANHAVRHGAQAVDALPRESWVLTFASADGSTFSVHTEQDGDCGPLTPLPARPVPGTPLCRPANSEDGIDDGCRCPPVEYPARALTLAAALRIFSEERMEPENPVWGYGFRLEDSARAGPVAVPVRVSAYEPWDQGARVPTDGGPGAVSSESALIDGLTGRVVELQWTATKIVTTTWEPGPVGALVSSSRGSSQESSGVAAALGAVPERVYAGTGAASLLVLLAAGLASRLGAVAVVAYTHLSGRDVEEHPRRALILRALAASPGLSTAGVREAAGLGSGGARHHLAVLVRSGRVSRVEVAGFTRYFLAGSADYRRLAAEAVRLGGGAEARVLECVRSEPGTHAAEVARRLGVSRAAVHYALARLVRRGLVREERSGRRRLLYVDASAAPTLTHARDA